MSKVPRCYFCEKHGGRLRRYCGLEVCQKCHLDLGFGSLEGQAPPEDPFMNGLVAGEDRRYVDAMNLYSTLYPRWLARYLLGIFLANLEEPDMTDTFRNSIVVSARSVWIFGAGTGNAKQTGHKIFHALHVLGNTVGTALMAPGVRSYPLPKTPTERDINECWLDANRVFLDVLEDLRGRDDGTLARLIDRTRAEAYSEFREGGE